MPTPVISIAQMREWERATWATGRSEAEVIRCVGKVIARHILSLTVAGDSILILAGKGHNGDDARCAREHLPDRRVEVFDVKDPQADLSKLKSLLSLRPSLVIDGLFGTGINRPLDAAWICVLDAINAAKLPVLAVDVPSGLNGDTGEPQGNAIEAFVTLTVGTPKVGLLKNDAARFVGRLEVAKDVGLIPCPIKSELTWTLPEDFSCFPPRRPVGGHKGTFGHLAIIAGSVGYHGASVLAARGAQRAQPGLITLFPHEPAYYPIAAHLQAVMVQPWTPSLLLPGSFTALLVGPGLASPEVPDEMKRTVRRLWRDLQLPMIVDASALDWLGQDPVPKNAIRVVTPHPGEAARMLKLTSAQVQADRCGALRELSRRYGNCWVVLKGHQTLVGRSHGEIFVNPSGNPFLAQGGSGDTLSGYLSGLLAQPGLHEDAERTIRFGAWQHGAAADLLTRTRPNWIVEDLLDTLGLVRS